MDLGFVEQLIKPLQSLLSPITNGFKHIGSNRIFEYQISECRNCLSIKTLLHKAQAVNLFDIYTPLRISKRYSEIFERQEDSLYIHDYKQIRSFLEKNKYLNIQGLAGGGKSTITKYLFIFAIKDQFKIPIRIDLRDFNSYVVQAPNENIIYDFIKKHIFQFQSLSPDEETLMNLLESGKFMFLFDGFDEVSPEIASKIAIHLEKFAGRYSENNFLVTSRPFTLSEHLAIFKNYWLSEFGLDEVFEFVRKQNLETRLEEKIIETIKTVRDDEYKSLFKNPLLLTMFILTYSAYPNIPLKKSEYYSQVFEALYSMHDSLSKLGFVRNFKTKISKQEFRTVLDSLCFITYYDNIYNFSLKYLLGKLKYIKTSNQTISFEAQDFVDDLLVSAGLIYQEGMELRFIHKSLQEYFAASFVINLDQDNKRSYFNEVISGLMDRTMPAYTEFQNFYSLMYEMDKINVIQYFEIPLYHKILQMLERGLTTNEFLNLIPSTYISFERKVEKIRFRQIRKTNGLSDAQIIIDDRGWLMLSDVLKEIIAVRETMIKESKFTQQGILTYSQITRRTLSLGDEN